MCKFINILNKSMKIFNIGNNNKIKIKRRTVAAYMKEAYK